MRGSDSQRPFTCVLGIFESRIATIKSKIQTTIVIEKTKVINPVIQFFGSDCRLIIDFRLSQAFQ